MGSPLFNAIDLIQHLIAREIVQEGLREALATMANMCGNPGQDSVYNDYVKPAFIENIGPVKEGWSDVDIGEYMDFMGEIVDEGNSIMNQAYEDAQAAIDEAEESNDDESDY